jgi:hypothetical protein
MENLDKNELIQLITFYRQKLSDTELDLLKLQLEINKLNSLLLNSTSETTKKSK